MTRNFDADRALEEWLAEGPSQLPYGAVDGIVRQLNQTSQRRSIWPPGRELMNRITFALGGVAAAVALVFVAVGLYFNGPGVAAPPPPTAPPTVSPTVEPTEAPSPIATPRPVPNESDLAPGTYAIHPLPAPDDSLTVTLTVPEGWHAFDETALFPWGDRSYEPPGGMAILFDDATSLNGDPCDWSGTDDDVSVGPAVDDLVEALRAQTAYEVSDPVDVTIGGYSGRRVDIVLPTEPFEGQTSDAPECDERNYTLWSTAAHGEHPITVQGPADHWRTNILDVEGTRLVIVTRYFPGTSSADRAEMDAIIDSIVIEP